MVDPAVVLVLNAGSSSLKYRLVAGTTALAGGSVGPIGADGGPDDHAAAAEQVLAALPGGAPAAVGHRVVHGGPTLRQPVLVDAAVEAEIARLAELAPVHNPAALAVIRAARHAYPGVPQVAVFDTAFHATLPEAASTYAIDPDVAARYGVRRYGFHGTSVRYVRDRTAELMGRPATTLDMIVAHLGNGASVTALAGGVSVATSMGLTPLEGLVMGSRAGDIDPGVTFHLARAGVPLAEIERLYEYRGGLVGLCGENDMASVQRRADEGDESARLALAVYCRRIRCYLGAYLAVLGRLDALVFTGGVGEHNTAIRETVLSGLTWLGLDLDRAANAAAEGATLISSPRAKAAVWVVPTDEEAAIADETVALLGLAGR